MSSALAIAAVTASLKDLLNDGLMDHDLTTLGSFAITAQPPDRVSTGATENNQLNLFLYRVTANSGWRNVGLPSHDAGGTRVATPPLALDLHYLLSAYGAQDLNAEVLLGYAMQVLHDTPVLSRQQLRTALGAPAPVDGTLLPGPFGSLSAVDLADQVELIKVTPVFLSADDLSKLWSAMQARWRPSVAYSVSVVLIQSQSAARAPLPVLKRGADDRGPVALGAPAPLLTGTRAAASALQPALRLGEDVLIHGSNLGGAGVTAWLEHAGLGIAIALAPVVVNGNRRGAQQGTQLSLHLPDPTQDAGAMATWAVGLYSVALEISTTLPSASSGGSPTPLRWRTNRVPLVLAPLITVSPLAHAAGTVNLTVRCTPRLRPTQEAQVRLLFGMTEQRPSLIVTPANTALPTTLSFVIPDVPAGAHIVRLRVDGIDSLPVTYGGAPAHFEFDALQTVTVT